MYRIGVRKSLQAMHFLQGDFGEESRPHAHPYTVEWSCEVDGLDADGFALDIALAGKLLEEVAATAEGRLLNDLPFFEDRQTSLENLASYFHDEMWRRLEEEAGDVSRVLGSEVRVWESQGAWASFASRAPVAREAPKRAKAPERRSPLGPSRGRRS